MSGWPRSLGSNEVITQRASPVILKIMGPTYWCHDLHLSGSRDVSCHMTTWFPRYHFLSIVTESLFLTISEIIWHFLYLGHDLDLSGSRDAIGHVTIWFLRCHFLKVLYCNRVSISNHFRDNGHFLYMGHDLDLSMSCDVISHVTIWFPKCHFL